MQAHRLGADDRVQRVRGIGQVGQRELSLGLGKGCDGRGADGKDRKGLFHWVLLLVSGHNRSMRPMFRSNADVMDAHGSVIGTGGGGCGARGFAPR